MQKTKKFLAVVLALVLSLSLLPTTGVSAASKKVKLNKTKATIYVGKTVTLKVKNIKKKVKWSTSNKKVATVTKKGKVKGKKAGKATITAKVGKKKYKCKITVKKKATPKPTTKPTEQPTTKPVEQPTKPVEQPTTKPVEQPTTNPVEQPTTNPAEQPTTNPAEQPTTNPAEQPTEKPIGEIVAGEWRVYIKNDEVKILEYLGNDTEVVIPSEIQGKAVTSIGSGIFGEVEDSVFYNSFSNVTKLTIPASIKKIDKFAFGCLFVKKIDIINNSSLDAESEQYWGAEIYEKEVNGLAIMGTCVVKNIDKDIREVIIPDGITCILGSAFYGCNLEKLVIPASVMYIEDGAFTGTYIQRDNIENNSSQNPDNLKLYDEVRNGLYITDNKVIGVKDKNIEAVDIPNGVTSIGYGAFCSCTNLTSVTIPDSVTSIESCAFECCESLTSVTIPDSVISISDNAFAYCGSLTSVTIPDSVTSIESRAFECCESLTSVTIPDSVTSIGDYAFYGSAILKNNFQNNSELNAKEAGYWGAKVYDEIVNGLYIVDNEVNGRVDDDIEQINIPEGVVSIKSIAFYDKNLSPGVSIKFNGYKTLKSVTISKSVTNIGENVFWGYVISKDTFQNNSALNAKEADYWGAKVYDKITNGLYIMGNEVIAVVNRDMKEVNIPDGITSIKDDVFLGCAVSKENFKNHSDLNEREANYWGAEVYDEIVNGLYIEDHEVVKVTDDNIEALDIPDGVTSIGNDAFCGCTNLTSVTIPDSVTNIGDYAFGYCKLTSVTIPDSVTSIGKDAFYGNMMSKENFKNNSALNEEEADYWGAKVYDKITNGLYIMGNKVIGVKDKNIEAVDIPNGVTSIGYDAFAYCGSLTSVTIPNSVTSIGDRAFFHCASLKSVIIPESVTSIGYEAFEYCYSLTSVTIPDSVTSIGYSAFSWNNSEISIKGKAGSYAETWANENGYTFVAE